MNEELRAKYKRKGLIYNDELHLFEMFFLDEVIQTITAEMVFEMERQKKLEGLIESAKQMALITLTKRLLNKKDE